MDLFNVPSAHIGLKWRRLALTLLLPQLWLFWHTSIFYMLYRRLLARIAFSTVVSEPATRHCWRAAMGLNFQLCTCKKRKEPGVCQAAVSLCLSLSAAHQACSAIFGPSMSSREPVTSSLCIHSVFHLAPLLSVTHTGLHAPRPCPDYLQLAADHFLAGATV